MGVTSPFSSRVRRAMLAPVGQAQVFREVRTEDELRQALTPVDVTTTAALLANTGRRIVIAAPITLTAPVEIPPEMPGTVIEAHGHIPIYPGVDSIDAFIVRAPLVTIRGLLLYADVDRNRRWNTIVAFKTGTSVAGSSVDPTNCRVLDCFAFGCNGLVYDHTAGSADDCYIERNAMQRFADDVNVDGIFCDSPGWRIAFNHVTGQGTGVAINVDGNGGHCAIVGNDCSDDGITTNGSSGYNTISANTRAGTITHHSLHDNITGGNT